MSISNSLIAQNSSQEEGGGIYNSSVLIIANCTIADNTATTEGGGIYNKEHYRAPYPTVSLENTIVAQNGGSHGPDIYDEDGKVSASYCVIGNGADCTALLNGSDGNKVGTSPALINPRFIDSTNENYRLQAGSSAINAGSNDFATDPLDQPLERDLGGHPRIQNETVDIGAYEFGMIDWGVVRLNLRDQADSKNLEWIDEWSGCWVEIWGQGDATTGIKSFDVELGFMSDCFTPDITKLLPGGAVDADSLNATVDGAEGKLRLAGTMLTNDSGQNAEVMLAKVYFKPTPGESVLSRDTDRHYLSSTADAGFQITEAELVQMDTSAVGMATVEQCDALPLWPVMYDLNGDSTIDLLDVAQMLSVFQWTVDDNAPPIAWMSDFDRSGDIDLLDVSEMLARFQWRKGNGISVTYPENFPFDESIPQVNLTVKDFIYADTVFVELSWSKTDMTAIAKDLTTVSTKKSAAASDELFTLDFDPYADLE